MSSNDEEHVVIEDLTDPLEAANSHLNKNDYNVFCCKVPDLCKSTECIVGIDEAGRGPVLGTTGYLFCE